MKTVPHFYNSITKKLGECLSDIDSQSAYTHMTISCIIREVEENDIGLIWVFESKKKFISILNQRVCVVLLNSRDLRRSDVRHIQV